MSLYNRQFHPHKHNFLDLKNDILMVLYLSLMLVLYPCHIVKIFDRKYENFDHLHFD